LPRNSMRVSAVIFVNAESLNVVTLLGMVSVVRVDTFWKELVPMLVTELGIVMLVRCVAARNPVGREVNAGFVGSVIEVMPLPLNA